MDRSQIIFIIFVLIGCFFIGYGIVRYSMLKPCSDYNSIAITNLAKATSHIKEQALFDYYINVTDDYNKKTKQCLDNYERKSWFGGW